MTSFTAKWMLWGALSGPRPETLLMKVTKTDDRWWMQVDVWSPIRDENSREYFELYGPDDPGYKTWLLDRSDENEYGVPSSILIKPKMTLFFWPATARFYTGRHSSDMSPGRASDYAMPDIKCIVGANDTFIFVLTKTGDVLGCRYITVEHIFKVLEPTVHLRIGLCSHVYVYEDYIVGRARATNHLFVWRTPSTDGEFKPIVIHEAALVCKGDPKPFVQDGVLYALSRSPSHLFARRLTDTYR